MWRPNDWKMLDNPDLRSVYEAGADAILTALLKESHITSEVLEELKDNPTKYAKLPVGKLMHAGTGNWVFIPEV